MPTLSTRTLAALAFERGEEFDPALTLPSAPLAEDLALLAGARPLICEPSPTERRRRRERARRAGGAPEARRCSLGGLTPAGHPRAPRPS
jgi:hypothetical protein